MWRITPGLTEVAYAYPDLGRLQAGGDEIVFRLRTRDLTPTFGSPLGAQLVDVYVHVPGATQTSAAASLPQRNYEIAQRAAAAG